MPKGPKKPERGVVWPKDKKGGRSTSSAGKAIIAASLAGIGSDKATAAAEKCAREKNWRFGYIKHFETLVRRSLDSPAAALASAKAGVEAMHSMFEFVGDDGAVSSFADLMASPVASSFKTGTVKGKGAMPKTGFTMPYKGEDLSGAALKQQLDRWAAYGTVEPDCAASLKTLVDDPSLLDLSGQTFVCIGAGSAMGPYPYLLSLGAHVIAVDIPGAWGERPTAMWQRLLDTAARSPGTVTFPKAQTGSGSDASLAGCDLMTQPHHILHWLKAECTKAAKKGSVTVGNYTCVAAATAATTSATATTRTTTSTSTAAARHALPLPTLRLTRPAPSLQVPRRRAPRQALHLRRRYHVRAGRARPVPGLGLPVHPVRLPRHPGRCPPGCQGRLRVQLWQAVGDVLQPRVDGQSVRGGDGRGCYYFYYYHHHYYYHSLPRFSGARPTPPTPSSPPRAGPRSHT